MGKKLVLYAEDERDDVFFMERAFGEACRGSELLIVRDGAQVKEYLLGAGAFADRARYRLPSLVLLDFNMPGISGLEVLKWIRTQPDVATIPVLALTSSNYPSDVHRAYAQGVNAYLLKPAQPAKLVEFLRAISAFWLELNQPPPDPKRFASEQVAC